MRAVRAERAVLMRSLELSQGRAMPTQRLEICNGLGPVEPLNSAGSFGTEARGIGWLMLARAFALESATNLSHWQARACGGRAEAGGGVGEEVRRYPRQPVDLRTTYLFEKKRYELADLCTT